MVMKYGALPMQRIHELLDGGFITGAKKENVRTGSLDLTLTDQLYRVNGAFLPSPGETVEQALSRVGKMPLPQGSVLERGSCYVCKLAENVNALPEEVYAYTNPKSSSGRLDIHVRLLTDRVSRYDSIPRHYSGSLWAIITPKKFSVIIPAGTTLLQARFFNQDTRLDLLRLETNWEMNGGLLCHANGEMILYKEIVHTDRDGSVILTLGLDYDIPGFEAAETGEPIDLSKEKHYDPEFFFRPVTVKNNSLALSANAFYILSTKEYVRVPVKFACEMAPMDERSGEIRSHFAGYVDSGWGIGEKGDAKGRSLTLEVRSFDNGLIILDGQPIAKIKYERVIEPPDQHYDEMNPNYGDQVGPRLSKHFKPWK
jgi:dCTP deaminase